MGKTYIFQGIILSVAIHLFFLWMAQFAPTAPASDNAKTIVVDLIGQSKKTIITDHQPKTMEELTKKLKEQAKYLSKKNQRVRREMVSRRRPGAPQKRRQSLDDLVPKLDARSDIRNPRLRPAPPIQENVVMGDGGSQDYIPMVTEGSFSAMNTDQFLYYTFYARINQQLRSRWVDNVREIIDISAVNELMRIAQKPRNTQVEIILDPDGKHVRTIITRASGERTLDWAVTQAFLQATPFANPPSEMIQDDGLIHLYYSFHILWDPRQLARSKR